MAAVSHCPLCIHPIEPNSVLIFLDMDGVLFDEGQPHRGIKLLAEDLAIKDPSLNEPNPSIWHFRMARAHYLSEPALKAFYSLIEKANQLGPVKIILSSAWRTSGTLGQIRKQMFAKHEFARLIIGKTPAMEFERHLPSTSKDSLHVQETYNLTFDNRADGIAYWLKDHQLENARFVILDDIDDKLSPNFPLQFVHVLGGYFSDNQVEEALASLQRRSLSQMEKSDAVLIFLEIHGILYYQGHRQEVDEVAASLAENDQATKPSDLHWAIAKARYLKNPAVDALHTLIEKAEKIGCVNIILHGVWTEDASVKEFREKVFHPHNFSKYIVGKVLKTPHVSKAEEIQSWLQRNQLENSNFVILDFSGNPNLEREFPNRLVPVSLKNPFSEDRVESALSILQSKSLINN